MVQTAAELQQLKGVGAILAKRLYDAGFDSFDKIAQAGEEGLKKVRGINPRALSTIVEQAGQLAQVKPAGHPERGQELKRHLGEMKEKIETLARSARDRFQQDLGGKRGRKLSSDLVRIEDALTQMEGAGKKRLKRLDKALVKAEKRVAGLEEAGLKKVRKGVKRARQVVIKALK